MWLSSVETKGQKSEPPTVHVALYSLVCFLSPTFVIFLILLQVYPGVCDGIFFDEATSLGLTDFGGTLTEIGQTFHDYNEAARAAVRVAVEKQTDSKAWEFNLRLSLCLIRTQTSKPSHAVNYLMCQNEFTCTRTGQESQFESTKNRSHPT